MLGGLFSKVRGLKMIKHKPSFNHEPWQANVFFFNKTILYFKSFIFNRVKMSIFLVVMLLCDGKIINDGI